MKRAAAAALVALLLCALTGCGDASQPPPATASLDACGKLLLRPAMRSCYERALSKIALAAPNPDVAVAEIDRLTSRGGEYLAFNCHVLMHAVGRTYAARRHLTLGSLQDSLPRSNDAGCAAGFVHGVISEVAPQINLGDPRTSAAVCDQLGGRYQRYSCIHGFGHAFMRLYGEALPQALKLCRALGADAPDCAQGAFHDYWFSVAGLDGLQRDRAATRSPRRLCRRQAAAFVRPCWYRAFIDTRPAGYRTQSPGEIEQICQGLQGLQRFGCVTAASVIGDPNPLKQFRVCSQLPARDIDACLHGVKVQNLVGLPLSDHVKVIQRCAWFTGALARACFRWLGKTLTVVTDGRFAQNGCPRLATAAQCLECRRGAADMYTALVTFS